MVKEKKLARALPTRGLRLAPFGRAARTGGPCAGHCIHRFEIEGSGNGLITSSSADKAVEVRTGRGGSPPR